MDAEFNPRNFLMNNDDFRAFVNKLEETDPGEPDRIITRYISYEPTMVEAALHVAADRGLITNDLKERLLNQIRFNTSKNAKEAKRINWEKYNAFTGYVSRYTDDEICNIIENPSDIVIDVYHAVLITANERHLISSEDFENIYADTLRSAKSDEDLIKTDSYEDYADMGTEDEQFSPEEIEAQKDKFWKCPSCNELVDIGLTICWNCQAPMPDKIERPGTEDIKKELRDSGRFSPVTIGFYLLLAGGLIIAGGYLRASHRGELFILVSYIFAALFILPGLALIIFGLFRKERDV